MYLPNLELKFSNFMKYGMFFGIESVLAQSYSTIYECILGKERYSSNTTVDSYRRRVGVIKQYSEVVKLTNPCWVITCPKSVPMLKRLTLVS